MSAETAVRLAKAFSSEPEFWLALQVNSDLAEVRRFRRARRCADFRVIARMLDCGNE